MIKKYLKVLLFAILLMAIVLTSCAPKATPEVVEEPAATEPEAAAPTEAPAEQVAPTEAPAPTEVPAPTDIPVPQPAVGGTYVFTTTQQPDTLDHQKTAFASASVIVYLYNATLLTQDLDGNFIPYLAESYEVSDDGLVLTFKLKEGIKFHNGDPVDANVMKFSFERMLDPDFVTNNSKTLGDYLASIEVLDDLTIRFTLNKPYHPIVGEFANRVYGPVSERALAELGEEYGRTPVGVGPYIVEDWITDEKIVLKRNPDFNWGPAYYEGANTGPFFIENIEYRFISEYATMLAGLEAGEITEGSIQPKDLPIVEATDAFDVLTALSGSVSYVIFNNSLPPFNNEKLRIALAYATNRQEIIDIVLMGEGVPVNGAINSTRFGYDPAVETMGYPYDLEKAKEMIQEAGYTYDANGKLLTPEGQPFEFTFKAINNESSTKTATVLQQQWEQLGLKMNITETEWATLSQEYVDNNFEIGSCGTGLGTADGIDWKFHSRNIVGITAKVNDPEMDQLIDTMLSEMNDAQWLKDASAVQAYIVQKVFWLSLYSANTFRAVSKNVEGEVYSPILGRLLFPDAYFVDLMK